MTIRDKLVDDVQDWKRWWSLRWIAAAAFFSAIPVAYMTLPPDWLPTLPTWLKQFFAVAALFSAGAAAASRVTKQQPKS